MDTITNLTQDPAVQTILNRLPDHLAYFIDLAIAIQQIPAPTFAEGERAQFVQSRLQTLGLVDVYRDEMFNVYARLPGQTGTPPVIVSAHLDTVFAAATDLTVRREGHLVYGPGIGDNSLGVAGLLLLAELMVQLGTRPQRDIWFVANVCEEGLGDLRGMRAVVDRLDRNAAAYIILEGGVYGHLFHKAIAVKRYRIEINTPGGHSWGNFGAPSAVHLLGRLIAAIDQITVPEKPRTSYNIGKIEGGTTVNSIAAQASLLLDCRSEDNGALADLLAQIQGVVNQLARSSEVQITMLPIGDRPAGQINENHPLVQLAAAALRASGCDHIHLNSGSTDANIPLSRGIPAVCVGLAQGHNAHRLDEYLDTTLLPAGMKQLLLLTLAAAEYKR